MSSVNAECASKLESGFALGNDTFVVTCAPGQADPASLSELSAYARVESLRVGAKALIPGGGECGRPARIPLRREGKGLCRCRVGVVEGIDIASEAQLVARV